MLPAMATISFQDLLTCQHLNAKDWKLISDSCTRLFTYCVTLMKKLTIIRIYLSHKHHITLLQIVLLPELLFLFFCSHTYTNWILLLCSITQLASLGTRLTKLASTVIFVVYTLIVLLSSFGNSIFLFAL